MNTKGGGLSGSQSVVPMMKEPEDSGTGMHIPATPSCDPLYCSSPILPFFLCPKVSERLDSDFRSSSITNDVTASEKDSLAKGSCASS